MNRFFAFLLMILLISCGALKRELNNATNVFFAVNFPDSIELSLLSDIAIYKRDSLRFPTNHWAQERIHLTSTGHPINIDSIKVTAIDNDSARITMKKFFIGSNNKKLLFIKSYGLKFKNDSLVNIYPEVRTSGK